MADSSAAALLFLSSPFHALPSVFSRSSRSKLALPSSVFSTGRCRSDRPVRSRSRDSDDGGDPYGPYPWESSSSSSSDGENAIRWVPEDKITLFTSEGLIQIGGSLVPRRFPPSDKRQGTSKASQRFNRFQESDYMDPNQGLCLGALFDIAATNGLDTGRRLCIFGFCRSIEMLSDVVEDTVLEHGGELNIFCMQVVAAEKARKGGLQEKLTMTVAVPLLWGVPPASETLHFAVRSGGGIVEKIYWQWDFL
ncbi:uncharacterized protein M6B38_118795 [Iris pallida]|uniref:DUF7811 domain-containing protein n=1 Tax=Iris pallida TaxID=29817 RepID=A0AAX6HJU0_IRIPA|nr:uncharacterized protein M6B38_118795 [Iris pallida]